MDNRTLFIKNMVCNRCILVVETELKKIGFSPVSVLLGEITLDKGPSSFDKQKIKTLLAAFDFDLIEDRKDRIVEQIKQLIIELIQQKDNKLSVNLSSYLSQKLLYEYNYLSTLFSSVETTTIEQFYILQKVEKIKELLGYGELSLKEIAHQLHYSSVAHLSTQFKKVTNLTTSQFKQLKVKNRKSIDKL